MLLASLAYVTTLSGIVYFVQIPTQKPVNYTVFGAQKETAYPLLAWPKTDHYGLPVRLKVPKLAVDAPVTYMGLTKSGAMDVPANIFDAGWYKHGTIPGNKGNAVLAGHVDGLKGQPGIFVDLHKLQKGDALQIIDSNNVMISFTVREARIYGQNDQPGEVFNASGAAHLNLITCTGAWDNARHSFRERLVVFADKIN